MSHTPGPWVTRPQIARPMTMVRMIPITEAGTNGPAPIGYVIRKDNADLMAAAPEMRDHLTAIIGYYDKWVRDETDDGDLISALGSHAHQVRALLARVGGVPAVAPEGGRP